MVTNEVTARLRLTNASGDPHANYQKATNESCWPATDESCLKRTEVGFQLRMTHRKMAATEDAALTPAEAYASDNGTGKCTGSTGSTDGLRAERRAEAILLAFPAVRVRAKEAGSEADKAVTGLEEEAAAVAVLAAPVELEAAEWECGRFCRPDSTWNCHCWSTRKRSWRLLRSSTVRKTCPGAAKELEAPDRVPASVPPTEP